MKIFLIFNVIMVNYKEEYNFNIFFCYFFDLIEVFGGDVLGLDSWWDRGFVYSVFFKCIGF